MEIITGVLLGLSTLLFMGAVFFYLIKTTLVSGIKAGVAVASGIIIGDIIYVGLLLFGFSEILKNLATNKWFGLFGGIILIGLGISYLIKRHHISETSTTSATSLWIHFSKGFVLNFVNPFVAAVWIGFLAVNEAQFESDTSVATSLIITLVVIFLTDLLKVFFAEKLSAYLKTSFIKKAYIITGIIMILFGLKLIYSFI